MPLELKCALCGEIIPSNEDYFVILLEVKTFDGQTILNDSTDSEDDEYCEKCCHEDSGIVGRLYQVLNKRNPNPTFKK